MENTKSSDNLMSQTKQSQSYISNINGYEIIEELGSGSFSTVYKVQKDNQFWALKMLEKDFIRKEQLQCCVENEINTMKKLDSPYCLKIFDSFEYKSWICLLLEYCNQGTLMQYIVERKPKEEECMKIFIQILKGFKAIHEKDCLHRDLKPENIFINDGIFKVADFGLAKTSKTGQTQCGSSYYMSPEILLQQEHDHKTDLWSLGVILYFMMFRTFPFKSQNSRINEIKKACLPIFNVKKHLKDKANLYSISDELQDLFSMIFVYDQKQRYSFSYLFSNSKLLMKFINQDYAKQASTIYENLEKRSSISSFGTQKLTYNNKARLNQSSKVGFKNLIDESGTNPIIEEDDQQQSPFPLELKQKLQKKLENENIFNKQEEAKVLKMNEFRQYHCIDYEETQYNLNIIGPKLRKFRNKASEEIEQITYSCRKKIQKSGEIPIQNKFKKKQIKDIYATYIFNIQKYNFIGDTINALINLSLPKNTDSIINYLLCKLLLFFAIQLKDSLQNGENIFNLEGFEAFLKTSLKEKLIQKLSFDILKWNSKFVMFYYSIDVPQMVKSDLIKKVITMEIIEKDYNSQLKQPTRMVLDVIFKYAYREGVKEYKEYQQLQSSTPQNMQSAQREALKKFEEQDKYNKKQPGYQLSNAFQILLCMVINNIFDFQSTKITFKPYYSKNQPDKNSKKGFDFWKFFMWIQKADAQILIESINTVIVCAYGNQRLQTLQNLISDENMKLSKDQKSDQNINFNI